MTTYKKEKATVKRPFTFKKKFYDVGATFEGKKEVLELLKKQNLI